MKPNKLHLTITFEKDGIYVETRGGADNMTQKKAIPRNGETDMKQELIETIMAYDPPPAEEKPRMDTNRHEVAGQEAVAPVAAKA